MPRTIDSSIEDYAPISEQNMEKASLSLEQLSEKKQRAPLKISLKAVLIALILVLVLAACAVAVYAFMSQEQGVKCPDGSFKSSLKECACPSQCCTQSSQYAVKNCSTGFECQNEKCVKKTAQPQKEACPLQCCPESGSFFKKDCPSGQSCEGGSCLKPECQSECCDASSQYRLKECPQGLECVDSNCTPVKQQCPFDCCTAADSGYLVKECPGGSCSNNSCTTAQKPACPLQCCLANDANYSAKACSPGYYCSSHSCIAGSGGGGSGGGDGGGGDGGGTQECPFECCLSSSGYLEKTCPSGRVCENSLCQKPDCPAYYQCCSVTDPFKEKECALGSCYYHICPLNCSSSTSCIAGSMLTCLPSAGNLNIASESYLVEVTGIKAAGVCGYSVELTASGVRPERIGQSMTCEIPYTTATITTEFISLLTSGQLPQYCQGELVG